MLLYNPSHLHYIENPKLFSSSTPTSSKNGYLKSEYVKSNRNFSTQFKASCGLSTPVFQFYSYWWEKPTPCTFHRNTVTPLPCKVFIFIFLSWVSGYKMEWNHVCSVYAQLQRGECPILNWGCLLISNFGIWIAVANRKQNFNLKKDSEKG